MPVIQKPCDTCWQPAPCASGRYRPWLVDRGSLTRRIEARSPGMKVNVLRVGRRRLHRDERFIAAGHALALTRDVVLYCKDTAVVYAHSVVQPGARGAGGRVLRGVGTRPLGAALFTDPRIRRKALHQRKLGRGHELFRQASRILQGQPGGATFATLWARRSLFMIGKSPILVTEVFLPGVLTL